MPLRCTSLDSITMLTVLAGDRLEGSGVNLVGSTALLKKKESEVDVKRRERTWRATYGIVDTTEGCRLARRTRFSRLRHKNAIRDEMPALITAHSTCTYQVLDTQMTLSISESVN